MTENYYSFKDFSFEFDTISLGASEDMNPQHRFLEILSNVNINDKKYVLDEKIEFIFPMFYRFSLSEEKGEVELYSGESDSYEWLIQEGIIEDVKKHSAYGKGIAQCYCKSEVGPSYIEIKQAGYNSMEVKLYHYKNINTANSQLKLHENIVEKRKIATYKPEEFVAKLPDLNEINIEYSKDDTSLMDLFCDNSFIDGIKSHWPIVGGTNNIQKYLYYFFTNNLKIFTGKSQGIGGVFVITKGKLNDDEIGFFVLSGYTLANKVALYQMQETAKNEAVKSAKAAIMSRNMSHNLGSHVMAYLKNDLRNVPAIFGGNVLNKLIPEKFSPPSSAADMVELPFLVGLGGFIGYLQERQDYIATIANSYIPPFSPVNFKDAIYDELNPDMRFERHHKEDEENKNRPQNILLSYIAKSEKLSRMRSNNSDEHDILLGYKSEKGIFGLDPFDNGTDSESLTPMRSVNVALPGGVVGRQAVFSIVENIIRNAAKHNNVQGNLQLVFEIMDGERIKYVSSDSIANAYIRDAYASSKDIVDLQILSITDNQDCADETVLKLRDALRQPYIGEASQSNKGIKEIRISATWLRGEDNDSLFASCPIDELHFEKGKLAPPVVVEKSVDGCLRYLIALKKTYEFALVYECEVNKQTYFERFSLPTDSYKLISMEKMRNTDTCFEYIVAENHSVLTYIRPYVTNRCVDFSLVAKDSFGKVSADMIYQQYTGVNPQSPCIVISDDKVVEENVVYKEKIKIDLNPRDIVEYRYRSHHQGAKEFSAYWCNMAERRTADQQHCIDGISGDNSSDRLVRRERLDRKWYIGHLYAMKSRVAVFDERLFRIIHGLDESQLTRGDSKVSEYIRRCSEGKWPEKKLSPLKIKNLAKSIGMSKDQQQLFFELYKNCMAESHAKGDTASDSSFHEKMISLLSNYRMEVRNEVYGNQYLTAAYNEKRVDVLTAIPMGRELCVVFGCAPYRYEVKSGKPVYHFKFVPVAKLYRDEKGLIKLEPEGSCKYDYISVHQGLVDKMFTEFGIDDDNQDAAKKQLMREFYNGFMQSPCSDEAEFLPRMTIHSGRGKITEKDIPLHQPFLQYSAIEHAVLDCKYSLVELLDFSKYKS